MKSAKKYHKTQQVYTKDNKNYRASTFLLTYLLTPLHPLWDKGVSELFPLHSVVGSMLSLSTWQVHLFKLQWHSSAPGGFRPPRFSCFLVQSKVGDLVWPRDLAYLSEASILKGFHSQHVCFAHQIFTLLQKLQQSLFIHVTQTPIKQVCLQSASLKKP